MPSLCKNSNCDFVYPIADTECAGNSLSSINFNFNALNNELCNIETQIMNSWNPAFTVFSENSAGWLNMLSVAQANSACWNSTQNIVSEMSAFWLKPISIVYPFPFPTTTDSSVILAWVNANFPIGAGNCYNYIVGQELFIYSPEYTSINRTASQSAGVGNKVVEFNYSCDCIGRGTYSGSEATVVNCGEYTLTVNVPDNFLGKFIGLRYVVDPTFQWTGGSVIFN